MREPTLRQPLITRPAYGEGNPALPKGDERNAESGLPEGGISGKGVPLDSGIPGSSTHNKPSSDEARDFDYGENESIYRTDNADDLLTNRERIDTREENADKHDSVSYTGEGKSDPNGPKTRYPYRDDHRNTMFASSEYVLAAWEADLSPTRKVLAGVRTKIAINRESIIEGLNPKFVTRAKKCAVALKRADIKNLRWILSVNCGNGPKVVKIKANRVKNITKLSKMDLDLSCSCPAWRWLGPEHHSQREEYLDGKPRGTASVPVIKDPTGVNRVCKHVAAVLSYVKLWDVAKKK